jgi:4-diphosphocytidyl-2-C-methyl-D-erythritol kinase
MDARAVYNLPSFAKINVGLHVLGVRPDGYHEIETILQSIDLHDDIEFLFEPAKVLEIHITTDHPEIPSDETNLIAQAIRIWAKVHQTSAKIQVQLTKRIPVGSGLGGGSSNAAATLVALLKYTETKFGDEALSRMAAEVGSDAPFFLYGGTVRATGRGEIIELLEDAPSKLVLLVHPKVHCSTVEVYKKLDEIGLTGSTNSNIISRDQRPESQREVVSQFENDLEKVVFALYPEIASIKKRLLELGASAAALTGSGSTVYGLFESAHDLEKAAQHFPGVTRTRFLKRAEYASRNGNWR